MKYIKLFENFNNTITMYHGTCLGNAENLIKNGWKPKSGTVGGNMGQNKYLYLTSEKEDALWFAQEKGCNTVIEVKNIPIDYLIFDPEDGDPDLYDYKIQNAIDKIINKTRYSTPVKLALTKELDSYHFKICDEHNESIRQFLKPKTEEEIKRSLDLSLIHI